jgi:hypothetical protein
MVLRRRMSRLTRITVKLVRGVFERSSSRRRDWSGRAVDHDRRLSAGPRTLIDGLTRLTLGDRHATVQQQNRRNG